MKLREVGRGECVETHAVIIDTSRSLQSILYTCLCNRHVGGCGTSYLPIYLRMYGIYMYVFTHLKMCIHVYYIP